MKNRIRIIRDKNNLTQTEFGERIGIKGNTVTNYENGLRNPSNAMIASICKEFNISETWLRTGEGEMEVRPPEDIVDRLAREYHLGASCVVLLRAVARVVTELPEEVSSRILDEVYEEIQSMRSRNAADPQASSDAALDQRLQPIVADRHQRDADSTVGGA